MESYIIRVFQRDPREPARISGLVEMVETGARRAFHGREELWAILMATDHPAAPEAGDSADQRAAAANGGVTNGGNDDS